MIKSRLYRGVVMHHRLRPKQHRFSYKVTAWLIDLKELPILQKKLRGFSWNRFNLIAFNESDYGDGSASGLIQYINSTLQEAGFKKTCRIELLCYPRYLGYTFNPLSTYFCYDQDDNVFAIVYEVSNTFSERHSYLIEVGDSISDDNKKNALKIINQAAEKSFYVSPFNPESGQYHFRIMPPEDHVSIVIDQSDDQGNVLHAAFHAKQVELHAFTPLYEFLKSPFMTVKIISAIHWEAVRLWLKGLRPYHRSKENSKPISIGSAIK